MPGTAPRRNMRATIRALIPLLVVAGVGAAGPAAAQIAAPNAAGVAMGHLHYVVADVDANRRFWVSLGGTPLTIGETAAVKFADVFVLLSQGTSTGGSDGSVLNHVAFRVPAFADLEARGLEVQRLRGFPGVGFVTSPEGERIELFEDAATNLTFTYAEGGPDAAAERHNRPLPVAIAFHHVHFYLPEGAVPEARAWYVRAFGGIPGTRGQYDAVDLPGINFNFGEAPRPAVPTRGRMLDHLGLEVVDLPAFCRRLEGLGVVFEGPCGREVNGIATARFTDPWGTSIELTEGLRRF
jgi:catechol 2,3-dioxygenase-like lactoylglutathione lyase family enzyme